ncbi:MAG: nucleoside hydrolase [Pseudomonadota bacterium]
MIQAAPVLDVIFDTDLGVDDAMALLYLHGSPSVRLRGICTGVGNAPVELTTRNTLYMGERFGIDAPVYVGEGVGLDGTNPLPPPALIHGQDGLGNIGPVVKRRQPESQHAADYIAETVMANPGKITVITVGRLTNLALALRREPSIARAVKQVIIMGGATGRHGHSGNVSPVAEANVFGDPIAADEVFGAPMPLTLVGLDVTQQVFMTDDDFDSLRRTAGEVGEFIYQISRVYTGFHREWRGLNGCYVHDSSAAIYAVKPTLFDTVRGQIRVPTTGAGAGQTILSEGEQDWFVSAWQDRPLVDVCVDVDREAVLDEYRTVMARLV